MAFTNFKNLNEVVKVYKLFYDVKQFIPTAFENSRKPSAHLKETLEFNLKETVYDISEAALCESLIFPILQDVWKQYLDTLFLWSHTGIEADETLVGIPDYLIAQKSEFGRILGTPLLTTVEAKKDNFSEGWTQVASQLVAMQKLNKEKGDFTLFGIVTNGELWEFASLQGDKLNKNPIAFSVFEIESLFSAVDYIMAACAKQVR